MCSGVSLVSFEGYLQTPNQQTTFFRDGSDPVCCSMRSTVYSRLSAIGLLEKLRLLNEYGGTSQAELACGVRVWRECVKGGNIDIAIAWDN